MLVKASDKTVFCDVDDTLISYPDEKENEFTRLVQDVSGDWVLVELQVNCITQIRHFEQKGYDVVLWSQQGGDWSKRIAVVFEIESLFSFFCSKPIHYIDDLDYHYWMPAYRNYLIESSIEQKKECKKFLASICNKTEQLKT